LLDSFLSPASPSAGPALCYCWSTFLSKPMLRPMFPLLFSYTLLSKSMFVFQRFLCYFGLPSYLDRCFSNVPFCYFWYILLYKSMLFSNVSFVMFGLLSYLNLCCFQCSLCYFCYTFSFVIVGLPSYINLCVCSMSPFIFVIPAYLNL